MKKIFSVFIALLIVPSLVFATGQCKRLSDEQYRNQLTSHPQVVPFNDNGKTGTLTISYDKNGIGKANVTFKCYFGAGVFDVEFDWSVNNAILHRHMTKAWHNDTHSKQLNNELDYWVQGTLEDPDEDVPLDTCGSNQTIKLLLKH